MNKIFVLLFLLFVSTAFADDYILTGNAGECDNTVLRVVNTKTYLTPVYTPIEYTCSVGTFLPANTTSCANCPSGYTCSGGTYAFNEKIAQGIVANTDKLGTTKTCSTNLLRSVNNKTRLTPIYEPNTININWDNGNNTTTTTTCEYNSLITLPPEPTRPGYTFSGWVLKIN